MILSQLNNSNYSAPSSNKEENSEDEVLLHPHRATTASHLMPMRMIGPVLVVSQDRTSTYAKTQIS